MESTVTGIAEQAVESMIKASLTRQFFSLHLLANQYPQLHAVRVLAIVMVVQFLAMGMATNSSDQSSLLWRVSSSLWFGMDLFFILSGFLIGTILLYSTEQEGTIPRSSLLY